MTNFKLNSLALAVALCFISQAQADVTLGTGATGGGFFDNGIAIGDNARSLSGGVAVGTGASSENSGATGSAFGSNAFTSGVGSTALGAGANANGNSSTAIGHTANASAIDAVAIGNGAIANQADTVSFGGSSGLPGQGSVTRRLVNVSDGIAATDAATVGQMNTADNAIQLFSTNLQTSLLNLMGNGGTANPDGSIFSYFTLTGLDGVTPNNYFTLQNALSALDTKANAASGGGGGASVGTIDTLNNAFVVGDPAGVAGQGGQGAPVKVTNVANGNLNAFSTDAVNGSQLFVTDNTANAALNTANALSNQLNGSEVNIGVGSAALQPGNVAVGAGSIAAGFNSVAIGAGTVATRDNSVDIGGRQLTGVAAGTQSTDGVNVQQLQDAIASFSGGGNPSEIKRLDGRIDGLSKDIKQVARRAYGGSALAMAMSGAAPDPAHDASFSLGTAMFNGEGAIAGSLQLKNLANGAIVGLGFGVTTAQDVGVRANITWQWNPSITQKKGS